MFVLSDKGPCRCLMSYARWTLAEGLERNTKVQARTADVMVLCLWAHILSRERGTGLGSRGESLKLGEGKNYEAYRDRH